MRVKTRRRVYPGEDERKPAPGRRCERAHGRREMLVQFASRERVTGELEVVVGHRFAGACSLEYAADRMSLQGLEFREPVHRVVGELFRGGINSSTIHRRNPLKL